MRFVVITNDTDGYTYSCDVVNPIEFESIEGLSYHLEQAARKAYAEKKADFEFAGRNFGTRWFIGVPGEPLNTYYEPQILTLDEWFESK